MDKEKSAKGDKKQCLNIMALLSDLEPPSSQTNPEVKNQKSKSGIFSELLASLREKISKLVFFVAQFSKIPSQISLFFKNNFHLLPHAAILFLLLIVLTSNLTQTVRASTLFLDFATPNPYVEAAVAQQVDQFTPLISADNEILDKYLNAQSASDGFAMNTSSVSTALTARIEPLPDNTAGDVSYFVKSGDVLSVIAMQFDIKTSTLKYVNDLSSADAIKPGMKLKIPKKGYEVSATQIAKKEAEKTKKLATTKNATSSNATVNKVNIKPGSSSNGYTYGYCTYYVAIKRYVPGGWGNANRWFSSAQRGGYATGRAPAVGAIMVSGESWLGHVAYVESVNNNGTFTISEMNAKGWGVRSSRTIRNDYGKITGFIY